MFEKKAERILPVHLFARRMAHFVLLWLSLMAVALSVGVARYYWIGDFTLVDAILNASMILTGMGPVSELPSTAAKLFASACALFSGLVFMSLMGIFLVPVAHRMLHRFHMDDTDTLAKTD